MRLLRQSLAARDVRGGPSLSVTSSPGESVAPYSPGTIRGAVVVRLESLPLPPREPSRMQGAYERDKERLNA